MNRNFTLIASALTWTMIAASAAPASAAAPKGAASPDAVLNDAWYTMQAGSTPFGYFHEIIESRGGRYSYRYSLAKLENNYVYEENIGAIAASDLTPVAFNLNKSGASTTESTNATYSTNKFGGVFKIQVTGARATTFSRACKSDTILDVFFPVWVRKHWASMKPGAHGWLNTFAEDPEHADFRSRMVKYEVRSRDSERDCTVFHVEMDTVRGDWCMTSEGVLIDLKVGSYHVKRVSSEAEAKAFVAGVFPKKKE